MESATLILILASLIAVNHGYIPRILNGRPKGGFLGVPGGYQKNADVEPEPQWFEQRLNHFDHSDTRTWKQKYFVNGSMYRPGGPIFVNIGGEGKASPAWVQHGAWLDYARIYKAYCILVEHRYYGDSHPTSDMSTANLKYLSSEQALEDLANIVTFQKAKFPNAKVIVFGGSYSGALAAWFRMKYPHLVHGAVASSAPVLAKLNFKEYLEVVDSSLATYDSFDDCNSNINMATALMVHSLRYQQGRDHLKKLFNLCAEIDPRNKKDISNLFNIVAGNIMGVVQYNKDNRAFEGAKDMQITIDKVCRIMTDDESGTPLVRYAQVNSLIMKTHTEKCLDYSYKSMIKDMQASTWNSSAAEGGRQWMYQTCAEFAYFQTTDGTPQPFGEFFPLSFSIDSCTDIFGDQFTASTIKKNVMQTNMYYGGRDLQVTRVLFPNGSIDPWHALSILKDINKEAKAIYINGTAHCANMYPAAPGDIEGLKAARQEIEKNIGLWLVE